MNYSCRPGIVMTKICGVWLLIPTREASEQCPGVIRLTLPSVIFWGMLEKNKTQEDMSHAFKILTHKTDEEIQKMIDSMLDSFLKKNLLIAEDDA